MEDTGPSGLEAAGKKMVGSRVTQTRFRVFYSYKNCGPRLLV